MSVSEYKRALLYRKAQANVCKSDYFNKIQAFTNGVVEDGKFLTLEETDGIINFLKEKEISSKTKLKIDNYQQVVEFIKEKVAGLSSYLLIDEEWKFCEIYKISNGFFSDYNFYKLHSDETRIISCNLSFQIQIDCDYNEIECKYILYK
ncbi:MAG: hypothetical protein E7I63_18420 [Citrobacter koseri]|uniref:hypothetical protein n=1 Tax=Citrobacter koseri TaxID=545 RepID=UPI000B2AF858|nr:hypothetical protein [Citrobacter koseri]MDT7493525.1 hypothetical protein [Citrobacter koseri]MDU4402718.1 hypothetical protein [Citrobacter koseri]CAG0224607.1 hypothetical protein AN2351V1_0715 [Citrobacter koseri]CAH5969999.1 hypothetical protein AN2351V1_0715 [Citrobacter koseri]HBD7023497.1 hypothetical protein [Citrobacter koseri]